MSTVEAKTRYTPDDLLRMPDGDRYELIDGQLVEMNVSLWSSYVAGVIHRLLGKYCDETGMGWALPEGTTYQCFPARPEMVRKADASVIRADKLSVAEAQAEGHTRVPPTLAVEVISPNDTAVEVALKVQAYLDAGVPLVWVVEPESRTVQIHRAAGPGAILRGNDELTGEEVLPGFRCRVGDLFLPPPGVVPTPPPTP
jgi:Uma2 family endonuclease